MSTRRDTPARPGAAPSLWRPPTRSRWGRPATVGAVALGLLAGGLATGPAQAIDSNPPTGPGNIEVFPARDMVAVEGYADQAGKRATLEVRRGGQLVGSAVGTVDATGFLEANHPGGVCWGAGTDLKVTPDITAGDEVRVTFSDGHWDGSRVSDAEVTEVVTDEAARTLTISGRYGPGVDMPGADLVADPGKFGVEIVNPDMRAATSGIGARAIGWPTDDAPTGHTVSGSVTGTDASGGTFAVTYGFQTVEDLALAEAGEVVALAWLAEPPPELGVEAQLGITLNEFYEHGGPGMGGCPPGPAQVRSDAPTEYTAKGAGAGSLQVGWQAGSTVPGAPAITGYSVRAVRGEDEVGKRLGADARSTTLTGLVAGEIYSVEIAAKSAAGEGVPAVVSRVRAATHVVPTATATTLRRPNADGKYAPLVTSPNGDFGVHLDPVAGLLDAEVHYTVDGSTPTLSSPTFVPGVSDSLQVRQDTTLRWIVVDSGNVVGPMGSQFYDIVEAAQAPPSITAVAAAPVAGAVDVTFARLTDPSVNAYRVQAYDSTGTVRVGDPLNAAQPTTGDTVVRRMTGLTNGTAYTFTVAARYGTVWSTESAPSAPVAPEAPAAANAGPDQSVLRGRTVTLDGTASAKVTSYSWVQIRPRDTVTLYQDPLLTLTGATTAKPNFRFPVKSSPTSDDGVYTFRLTTTHTAADGTTTQRSDLVDVKEQRDVVVATEARWRAGNPLRLTGTGSQENAQLTFRDATVNGAVIGTAVVTGGAWTAPAAVVNLSNGSIYVWSDHGFVGTIQTTR